MSCLFFDLGNTRIKWWDGHKGGLLQYEGIDQQMLALCEKHTPVSGVVFASVVKDERRQRFLRSCRSVAGVPLFECLVTPAAAGVTCAYSDVQRLGIDRWLALVAAWSTFGQSALVVDLGTAATFDFLGGDGTHQGGYILPGLRLGISGLLAGTSNIIVDQDRLNAASLLPGKNTNDAVYHGAVAAMTATIESSLARLKLNYPEAKLLLTGGDAELVGRQLGCHHEIRGQLVFEGMRLLHDHQLTKEVPLQDIQ